MTIVQFYTTFIVKLISALVVFLLNLQLTAVKSADNQLFYL